MAKKRPGKNDVVVGIAASGRTPFTVAAVAYARSRGAQTVAVTCNRNSPACRKSRTSPSLPGRPEVISGSSRMKAGTAQKMVLNMLSTGAMTRLGYVYDGLMVNVHLKNEKLVERGLSILQQATGRDRTVAEQALRNAANRVPVALVMLETGVSRIMAERSLKASRGHVRTAIALARRTR